jgi:hypothetical protein
MAEASNGSLLLPHTVKCFKEYHQNILGLQNKTNELIIFLSPNFPHIIYLYEHHLRNSELDCTFIDYGTKFCSKALKNGGVCFFIHEALQFRSINLNEFCKEQDLEVCAVKLHLSSTSFCILSIYRSPIGNF